MYKLYDNSESINLNDEVRRILLNLNEKIYNVLLNSLEAKHVLDNTDNSINKDFGRIIDISKINFGVELDQVLLAWPSLGWAGNLRVLRGRVATGFKGGYWTAGAGVEIFRLLHIDIGFFT